MQDTFLEKKIVPKSNRKLYVTIATFAVVAVVACVGCSIYMLPVEEPISVTTSPEVPHYIKNMWFNWKAKHN